MSSQRSDAYLQPVLLDCLSGGVRLGKDRYLALSVAKLSQAL